VGGGVVGGWSDDTDEERILDVVRREDGARNSG